VELCSGVDSTAPTMVAVPRYYYSSNTSTLPFTDCCQDICGVRRVRGYRFKVSPFHITLTLVPKYF
jgi:hypothetical protein